MLKGLDCSSYQGEIDWKKVKEAGYSFAFIKAFEAHHVDGMFHRNWDYAKLAGITRGAYAYFHPELDPTEQATLFCETVHTESGDLPLVADVEMSRGGLTPEEYGARLKTFLAVVEADRSQIPIVYCSPGIWNPNVAGDFSRHPLWTANYNNDAAPHALPRNWSHWTFWQHSSTGRVPGVQGNVDLDRFRGTEEDLKGLLKKKAP